MSLTISPQKHIDSTQQQHFIQFNWPLTIKQPAQRYHSSRYNRTHFPELPYKSASVNQQQTHLSNNWQQLGDRAFSCGCPAMEVSSIVQILQLRVQCVINGEQFSSTQEMLLGVLICRIAAYKYHIIISVDPFIIFSHVTHCLAILHLLQREIEVFLPVAHELFLEVFQCELLLVLAPVHHQLIHIFGSGFLCKGVCSRRGDRIDVIRVLLSQSLLHPYLKSDFSHSGQVGGQNIPINFLHVGNYQLEDLVLSLERAETLVIGILNEGTPESFDWMIVSEDSRFIGKYQILIWLGDESGHKADIFGIFILVISAQSPGRIQQIIQRLEHDGQHFGTGLGLGLEHHFAPYSQFIINIKSLHFMYTHSSKSIGCTLQNLCLFFYSLFTIIEFEILLTLDRLSHGLQYLLMGNCLGPQIPQSEPSIYQLPSSPEKQRQLDPESDDEHQDVQEDIFSSQRAVSKVYKRTNSEQIRQQSNIGKRLRLSPQKHQSQLDEFEGVIQEEQNCSRIYIYNSEVAMEFTLPKKQAGPLLAPFMDYEEFILPAAQSE